MPIRADTANRPIRETALASLVRRLRSPPFERLPSAEGASFRFTKGAKQAQLIRTEAADPDRTVLDTDGRWLPTEAGASHQEKIPLRIPEIPPLRDSEIRRIFSGLAVSKYSIISIRQPISDPEVLYR